MDKLLNKILKALMVLGNQCYNNKLTKIPKYNAIYNIS